MSLEQNIVKIINNDLETTWTEFEWENGKVIEVEPDWRESIQHILKKYREAGWNVRRHIELSSSKPRKDYVVFKNPVTSYKACPEELKASGV